MPSLLRRVCCVGVTQNIDRLGVPSLLVRFPTTSQVTMHLPKAHRVEALLLILWQRLRWTPFQVPNDSCVNIAVFRRKRAMLALQADRFPDPRLSVTEQWNASAYKGCRNPRVAFHTQPDADLNEEVVANVHVSSKTRRADACHLVILCAQPKLHQTGGR